MRRFFDENVPGIVGTVRQNNGGHLVISAEFYRDKQLKKMFLAGKCFAYHCPAKGANCYRGDYVRIDRAGLVNLTEKYVLSDFRSLLSKSERELLANCQRAFLFNGSVAGIQVVGDCVSLRFHVSSRINEADVMVNVNKMVSYSVNCAECDTKFGESKGVFSRLSALVSGEQLTFKLYRKPECKADLLNVIAADSVENADNYVKKHC